MMLSNSHLLAGQGHTPPGRFAELARSRQGPAVFKSPPPSRTPTSASSSNESSGNSSVPSPPSSSAPLFDAVISAFFEQLCHSVDDFSENQHWRMVGGWQAQGMPDEAIYDTLQTLFPDHGSPLTLYEELYVPALNGKGFTPMGQIKPSLASINIQTQQGQWKTPQLTTATATTTLRYPKPPPAPRMLHQQLNPQQSLDSSINSIDRNIRYKVSVAINVGDYVNVRPANYQGLHSRGGNGYVACKESIANGNGVDFVFTVAYVDAFLSGGQSLEATESKITRDRLTVLPPSPYLTLGNPKQGIVTETPTQLTAAPKQQPPEIQPPSKLPINRLTVQQLALAPAPEPADRCKRKGSNVKNQSSDDIDEDNNGNHEIPNQAVIVYGPPACLHGHENLAEYLQKNHSLHRAQGWRQDDFADVDLAVASVKRKLLLQDIMWMEHYLNEKGRRKGPKQAKTAKGDYFHSNSFVRNKKSKSSNKINDNDNDDSTNRSETIHPLTMRYLAYSWGIGKNTPKELLKRANIHSLGASAPGGVGSSIANNPEVWKQRSVIECRRTASKHYSAKHLYVRHRIAERRRLSNQQELEKYNKYDGDDADNDNDDASSSGSFLTYQYRNSVKDEWDALDAAAREPWEQKAKWHDEMQPSIQRFLVGEINNNPYRTYQELASDIGDWCGASTIQRWLTAKNALLKEE
jgi:hypothetical protein